MQAVQDGFAEAIFVGDVEAVRQLPCVAQYHGAYVHFVAAVSDALTAKGYKLLSAQVEMLPQNGYIKLTNEDDIKNMQKMLDMFEDNDDVQNVWHNWEDAE